MIRLFPVPFRLIEDEQQFRKWQWIRARVRRAQDDARPESHRVSVDTIHLEGEPLPTRDRWQARKEGNLFDAVADQRTLKTLKKLPFDFHYRYDCPSEDGTTEHRHKLVDWEAGALYWNIHRRSDWQHAFLHKFVTEFRERDVLFLMGTIHRFPGQWLIVSVLYLPRLPAGMASQHPLF